MYKRFSQAERDLALKWARQGKPPSKIASLLDRDPGTISRQLAKPKGFVPKLGRLLVKFLHTNTYPAISHM